jgi:hypothetical protein
MLQWEPKFKMESAMKQIQRSMMFLGVLGLSLCASAQPSTQESKPSTPVFSKEPLDLKLTQLPPHYMGNDPTHIVRALRELHGDSAPVKDEWESTAAFQERVNNRVKNAPTTPVVGKLTLGSVFASQTPSTFSYDADAQAFNVNFHYFVLGSMGNHPVPGQLGARHRLGRPNAAMGVQFDGNLRGFLPMDVATAQAVKQNLRILVVYEVIEPHIAHTRDSSRGPFIPANLLEIWCYNEQSGEVYRKAKIMRIKGDTTKWGIHHWVLSYYPNKPQKITP